MQTTLGRSLVQRVVCKGETTIRIHTGNQDLFTRASPSHRVTQAGQIMQRSETPAHKSRGAYDASYPYRPRITHKIYVPPRCD
jgi:hypothetical protein